jgi:hypothetical protein
MLRGCPRPPPASPPDAADCLTCLSALLVLLLLLLLVLLVLLILIIGGGSYCVLLWTNEFGRLFLNLAGRGASGVSFVFCVLCFVVYVLGFWPIYSIYVSMMDKFAKTGSGQKKHIREALKQKDNAHYRFLAVVIRGRRALQRCTYGALSCSRPPCDTRRWAW